MKRSEVWWGELEGDAGYRPAVIVSRTTDMDRKQNIIIAEVTTVVRTLPSEVVLAVADGMPADCVINTDALHTISRVRLRSRILSLTDELSADLDRALRYTLDLEW